MGLLRVATHATPVWRARANFIIATNIDPADTDVTTEQLWARKISERTFELCCIPFFAYDLALGDVAETDSTYMVERVATRSGRYVFRVWFGGSISPREAVAQALEGMGALREWSSPNLLAVDARDGEHARYIAGFLQAQEDAGVLVYETGKT